MAIKMETDNHHEVLKVLLPCAVFGWIMMGAICILCINGCSDHGGRGWIARWVPKWHLDTQQTGKDKMYLILWWLGIVVFWPFILPLVAIKKVVSRGTTV